MKQILTLLMVLFSYVAFAQEPLILNDIFIYKSIAPNQMYFIQGIFNGLLLMMLLYNLFLYISSKDKSYLYYVLYVFFTTIFILHNYGYIQEFFIHETSKTFFSDYIITWNNIFIASLILSNVFYLLLMRVFLGNKEKHPLLYKIITIILYFLIGIAPVLCVIGLIDVVLYELVSRTISVITLPPLIVILVIMFIKGDKLARYFAIGSFALFAGVLYILTGVIFGYNPDDLLYGYQLGVIAQVFIFSMGLSYRFEQMSKENIQSQHKALKSQIDPHFFFNSLSVLSSLVYKDADKSAEYVTQLSKVYRNILDKSKENLVPLENELKLLDSYIFLMKIRFGDNISFAVEITENTKKETFIPPNTLQLLIENAIKHNKCSSEEPLSISIYEDKENIYVKNNLNLRTLIDKSSGIGLDNIKRRFDLLKGKHVKINEDENSFIVVLPKYSKSDYEGINI